jgi:hypothetical protein
MAGMIACNNQPASKQEAPVKADPKSGIGTEPTLTKTDSLQIIYYDDPDGDSLRYTRYFKYIDVKDTAVINTLLANLLFPFEKRDSIKDCRSEGKLYLYDKKQEAIKTVYFSTRCDTCCYLYFIKEGAFYYSKLSDPFKRTLQENKGRSHN